MPRTYWSDAIEDWKSYIRGYGEGVGFPSRVWFAELLKKDYPDGVSVLDDGCGGGIEYESLCDLKVNVDYHGSDYTPEAIDACKEMFPEANFSVEDARRLSFEDQSFDVVLIRHTLDHIVQWEDAMREGWRVAKKELVVILWTTMFEDDREKFEPKGDDVCLNSFSKPKMKAWVEENLKPSSITFEQISAAHVPGRAHRTDFAIRIKR